jgi:Skp family chaperone for outer membrane proteins
MQLKTNNNIFLHLGWVVAAISIGYIALVGFQGTAEKTAVVDINVVVRQSTFGQNNSAMFERMKASREGLLKFITENPVISPQQLARLRELELNLNRNANQTRELETVRNEVIADMNRYQALATKASPSDEDKKQIADFATRVQQNEFVINRLINDFTQELQTWADEQNQQGLQKARQAIATAAQAGNFTIVFDAAVAPYGANDLTQAALKAMNDAR